MTDEQMIKYVRDFCKGLRIVTGNLADAGYSTCTALAGLLAYRGVKTRVVIGRYCDDRHTWLELDDRRILDPTAAQFNDRYGHCNPDVFLGDNDSRWFEPA